MAEYKVNLPKTDFPMKADLAKREPNWLKYWEDIDLYNKLQQRENAQTFILHDGPPYANGEIHMGHALNKILKDIVNKSKILSGYRVPYVPGWDCHGLPIEVNIEKKLGRVGDKVSAEQFVGACRKYANEQINIQRDAFMRLGVLGDWRDGKCYKTMDSSYEANIIRALAKIIANGYVERGHKPVHWCTACGSALAEAEVEYIDKSSPAIDVRFRVIDAKKFNVGNVSIPIWTTTPWTLPANEAVAVHPKFEYALVFCESLDANLLIANELVETVMQRYGIIQYKIIKRYFGENLENILLQHPFLQDKKVPIILGEHVTIDTGTGAVHTAPAHGIDDFRVGSKYGLPVKSPVDAHGCFTADTPFFAGQQAFAANEKVIELLRENGNLLHFETIQHSYPHCWRHKKPLIFRATQQWFISMDNKPKNSKFSLREQALNAIEQVKWIPELGKGRIKDMIEKRPDWCISRQRHWGTPMAIFTNKTTGEMHPEILSLMEIVAKNVEKEGISYWFKLDGAEFLKQHAPNHPDSDYEKNKDTLDVWFDSGVSHYSVLHNFSGLEFPAELYLEGSDQYRGWFQSSLLTSLAINGVPPYRAVLTHGWTVDAEGKKMSKSLGNVIAPQKVVGSLGADILRMWVGSAYIHDDLAISDEILQRDVDAYRMVRNTARFLLGNLAGFELENDLVAPKDMVDIDRYMVAQVLKWQDIAKQHYAAYRFHEVTGLLIDKISVELSSFYFSIIKDRLYTMPEKSLGRRSAQTALWYMLEILVRLFAPILSFTAEEIWQEMRKFSAKLPESVFLSTWYDEANVEDFTSKLNWDLIIDLRNKVNLELEKLRANGEIGSSLEAEVELHCDEKTYAELNPIANELRFIFITSAFDLYKSSDNGIVIKAKKSLEKKCCRCWHYREDVGKNKEHPELCNRCVDNIKSEV